MKNINIEPGDIVPADIRKEVYEQAINVIENQLDVHGLERDNGLCILLYCILWDLEHYLDNSPCGEFNPYMNTLIMFPEFTVDRKESIQLCDSVEGDVDECRLFVLNEMLTELKDNYQL